jgi:hypothetical protein
MTPVLGVKFPPGRYKVKAVNREERLTKIFEVVIKSGATTRLTKSLTE